MSICDQNTGLACLGTSQMLPEENLLSTFPHSAQVWIDFDGTITQRDVLDELIRKYAVDDSWHEVERLWATGQIGSYECLRREFDLIRIDPTELRRFLATIPVDPGAEVLFGFLQENAVPFAILSDGIDQFIRTVLGRLETRAIDVRANSISESEGRLKLLCPHRRAACESNAAHCKCGSACELAVPGRKTIYVGDGRSDLCPARKSDVVFAKGALARLLTAEGKPFIPFETLLDVTEVLRGASAGREGASIK